MLLLHAQKEGALKSSLHCQGMVGLRCKSFCIYPVLPCLEIQLLNWAFSYIISENNLETEDEVECGCLLLVLASRLFHNCYR